MTLYRLNHCWTECEVGLWVAATDQLVWTALRWYSVTGLDGTHQNLSVCYMLSVVPVHRACVPSLSDKLVPQECAC